MTIRAYHTLDSPAPADWRRRHNHLKSAVWMWGLTIMLSGTVTISLADATAVDPNSRPGESKVEKTPPIAFVEALELTDEEQLILSAVRDRSVYLDETAFYLLLNKAARIVERTDQRAGAIDHPAVENLLRYPQRYRGRPIRVKVRVYRVEKLTVGRDLSPSSYWAADRPIWKLSSQIPSPDDPAGGLVLAFSTVEPTALGNADRITESGDRIYRNGRDVWFSGFSYKVWKRADTQGIPRNYPVMVLWAVDPAAEDTVIQSGRSFPVHYGIVLVISLLMVYLWIRRSIKQRERIRRATLQRSHRDTAEQFADRSGLTETAGPCKTEHYSLVDPLLRTAAEQYRQEKGTGHADDENRTS